MENHPGMTLTFPKSLRHRSKIALKAEQVFNFASLQESLRLSVMSYSLVEAKGMAYQASDMHISAHERWNAGAVTSSVPWWEACLRQFYYGGTKVVQEEKADGDNTRGKNIQVDLSRFCWVFFPPRL